MVAKIGPAQGAQTTPNARPVTNPETNPVEVFVVPNFPLNLLTHPSKTLESLGTRSVSPKIPMTPTARKRKTFALKGITAIREERKSVRRPKLRIMPSVIPKGFLCPPVVVLDRMRGSSGQIQGAAMVTSPERNAKRNRSIMYYFFIITPLGSGDTDGVTCIIAFSFSS